MQFLQFSKMLRCIILSVLITGGFAMSAATPSTPENIIVGGMLADIRDHPYQLSLQAHLCGASIINDRWAVTAAHCILFPADQFRVRAGNSDKDRGTFYSIRNVVRHPNYNALTKDYDIALLEIDGTFEFNNNVQPISLAQNELSGGTVVNVTGWGTTSEGGPYSQNLMRVSVPIVERETCRSSYGQVTERMICAGYTEGGRDACLGDSGGPLATNGILYGVVSFGHGCARPNYPGVYSNVANLRQWITDTIGN